jgi:hypothetical protein
MILGIERRCDRVIGVESPTHDAPTFVVMNIRSDGQPLA